MQPNYPFVRSGALPREPTDAPPGSEQKIRVMIERATRREQLFHPQDGPGPSGRLPFTRAAEPDPWRLESPEAPPEPGLPPELAALVCEDDDPDELDEPAAEPARV